MKFIDKLRGILSILKSDFFVITFRSSGDYQFGVSGNSDLIDTVVMSLCNIQAINYLKEHTIENVVNAGGARDVTTINKLWSKQIEYALNNPDLDMLAILELPKFRRDLKKIMRESNE